MAENTKIEWATHTFNPWIGCTKVSPACDHCYAEAMMDHLYGRVQWGGPGKGAGTRVRTANWREPLKWNRQAGGKRPFVFCASLADVFDNQVEPAWRTDLFELIRATPNLVWLLLTKRPQNIVRMFGAAFDMPWPRNAAIGCTVEDQERADLNIPHLLAAKAELNPAFAFLSCEPLLGPVDIRRYMWPVHPRWPSQYWSLAEAIEAGAEVTYHRQALVGAWCQFVDWVIAGGESGPHARPMHPDWARSLRDQCAAAAVPFFFKQWGEWFPDRMLEHFTRGCLMRADGTRATVETHGDAILSSDFDYAGWQHFAALGKRRAGRLLDGVEHDGYPAEAA